MLGRDCVTEFPLTVQGDTDAIEIEWLRAPDDEPRNLTGRTISGVMINQKTGVTRPVQGNFYIVDAEAGRVDLEYHAEDRVPGWYFVQLTATLNENDEWVTYQTPWKIEQKLTV